MQIWFNFFSFVWLLPTLWNWQFSDIKPFPIARIGIQGQNYWLQILIGSGPEYSQNSTRLYLCPGQNSDFCQPNTAWNQKLPVVSDQTVSDKRVPESYCTYAPCGWTTLSLNAFANRLTIYFTNELATLTQENLLPLHYATLRFLLDLVIVYHKGRARTSLLLH